MTTVQIIGVSVAGAAVLLLIVALIVTRRRGRDDDQDEARPEPSFLDQAPQDTFSVLGKPEQDVEDITIDPAYERALAAEQAAAAARAQRGRGSRSPAASGSTGGRISACGGWSPSRWPRPRGATTRRRPASCVPTKPRSPESCGPTRRPPASFARRRGDDGRRPTRRRHRQRSLRPRGSERGRAAAREPARPAEGGPAAGEAAPESGSESRLVPLSDIIVTTSGKMVDLQDPDVRRMLTELVTFEIDQAADFRRRGQTIDAVLQLTEAEKVSRALGMTESAKRIRAMMEEIRQED